MKKIYLIGIIINTLIYADLIRNDTQGTVYDTVTKLEWQDSNLSGDVTWNNGIEVCERLKLNNYTDWRMPNMNELKSIEDKNSTFQSYIGSVWSSTSVVHNENYAWYKSFNYFSMNVQKKSKDSLEVICVRDTNL